MALLFVKTDDGVKPVAVASGSVVEADFLETSPWASDDAITAIMKKMKNDDIVATLKSLGLKFTGKSNKDRMIELILNHFEKLVAQAEKKKGVSMPAGADKASSDNGSDNGSDDGSGDGKASTGQQTEIILNFLDKREGAGAPYGTLCSMMVSLDTTVGALYNRVLEDYYNKFDETGDDFLRLAPPNNFNGQLMLGCDIPQNDEEHSATPLTDNTRTLGDVGVEELSIVTLRVVEEDDGSDDDTKRPKFSEEDLIALTDYIDALPDEDPNEVFRTVSVTVREFKGKKLLAMQVADTTSVGRLKDLIVGKIAWDAPALRFIGTDDFKLICFGKTMKNEESVSDYVTDDDELVCHIFLTLKGGAKQTKKTLKVKQYLISEKHTELTAKANAYSHEKFVNSVDIAKTSRERVEGLYSIMETNPEQAFKELLAKVPTSVLGNRENSELMEAIKGGVKADVRVENLVKILAKHNFKEAYDLMQEYQTLIESALLTGEMLITKQFFRDDGTWDWQMIKRYIDDEIIRRERPSSSADTAMRDA